MGPCSAPRLLLNPAQPCEGRGVLLGASAQMGKLRFKDAGRPLGRVTRPLATRTPLLSGRWCGPGVHCQLGWILLIGLGVCTGGDGLTIGSRRTNSRLLRPSGHTRRLLQAEACGVVGACAAGRTEEPERSNRVGDPPTLMVRGWRATSGPHYACGLRKWCKLLVLKFYWSPV